MSQKNAFFEGEGEAWFERNKDKLTNKNDPVLEAIEKYKLDPAVVLEIGCANGWRLDLLKKKYDCVTWGIDPASNGEHENILRRSADKTGMSIECFDLVIYGWCLYLVDRTDLLQISAEGDRVLQDGGYLVIYDFYSEVPIKLPYKHKDGIYTYKMDYSRLWLWNPTYSLHSKTVLGKGNNTTAVIILKKNLSVWD